MSSSLILCNNTISQSYCGVLWKVDFIRQLAMTSLVAAPRSSSKALPKAKLAPKKGLRHCLGVCCQSDSRLLSESSKNHYIWKTCSANQWDALKSANATTAPCASTVRARVQSSLWLENKNPTWHSQKTKNWPNHNLDNRPLQHVPQII